MGAVSLPLRAPTDLCCHVTMTTEKGVEVFFLVRWKFISEAVLCRSQSVASPLDGANFNALDL